MNTIINNTYNLQSKININIIIHKNDYDKNAHILRMVIEKRQIQL